MPGNRSYLRFDIPQGLIETNTIVRALLVMTQIPNRTIDPGDTLRLLPRLVRATTVLDPEPGKAALLLGNIASFPMPPISVTAADSGQQQFQIATAIAVWRQSPDQTFTRALVLQALDEGIAPHTALFYSSDPGVPQGQRPHLLLSYVPRAGFGLP